MKEQRICLKYINNSQFQKFRKFKMLMRPPTIVDQNDNLSHLNSQSDARQSSKSKNKVKRKQTSLTMKNKNLYTAKDSESKQKQKEHDNVSVHSHASGRSKRSKKKQSSIGINKPRGAYMTLNSPRKSQQDEQIRVLSYEDMNEQSQNKNVVQYSQVKNDYIGSNLNKQVVNRFSNPRQNLRHNEQYSFKNVFQNSSDLIKNQSSKQSNEDQVPVVKLVEAKNQTYINPNMNSPYNNIISPKMVEKKETKRLGQLFEENRRLIQNQSTLGVSGIPSQVGNSAIGTESRRSRSKLGQLFKQKSKQKEISNSSKVQFSQNASSNYQSISQLHLNLESNVDGRTKKDGIHGLGNQKSKQKQNIGKNNIPQKVLEQSAYHFQGAQQINKSDLNLSLSRNSPAGTKVQYNKFGSQINNKDSVCFNIEPEREKKRKGLGLASRLNSQSDQLIKVSGNLVSKQLNHQNSNQSAHERLKLNFYENEKYLIESGAFQSNDSINQNDQFKKREDNNKKKQRQEEKDRLQKEKLERIRQEKERQAYRKKEQSRIQQEKIRKQQENKRIQRIQRIRKEEENKKQEQRKLQQNLREEKRLKLQQQKKERQLEIERKKQRQIEEDKRKEKEIEMEKQLQRKRLIEQQQQMKAKIQRQRLKKAYNKQREQIRRSHQQSEKQKSIVQDLQNDSYHEDKMKKNKVKQNQFSRVPYSFSKQNSSKSQKSQESRKSTKKKQSVITKNKIKHYVGQISPRAEQSFYEQQRNDHKNKEQKFQQTIDQPRKLMSFSEQEDLSYEPKPEYKTDTYFYDKSLKAPSSKPPLSRKSSASKSKPKQGMITKKNTKDSQIKIKGPSGGNEKKLSLVELAMRKNYEKGSQSENQSQDSFRSRQRSVESYGSRNSSGSKGSRKKESVIRLKENTYSGFNRPPLQRKNSSQNQDSLKYKTWKHAQQMEQQSRYSNANKITEVESKIRVIKGCSFIDERGRLVENGNMMIKGNKVAGTTRNNQFTEKKMIERLMNSRQKRRSKSRQRSLNRSRTSDSIQKNNSKYSNSNSQTQKAFYQSQAYSESQGRYESSGSNFYGNTRNDHSYYREEGSKANYGNNGNSQYRNRAPQNLQQFMKPIEQAGVARVKNQTQNIYYERDRENNKKRTMQRTEKRM